MSDRPATPEFRPVYAWYVVSLLTLAYICSFIDRQIISLMVGPIKQDLGLTDTEMSYLLGLSFALFFSVLGFPIARLADRRNRRTIIAVGVVAFAFVYAVGGIRSRSRIGHLHV